jgi:hypothetical protein
VVADDTRPPPPEFSSSSAAAGVLVELPRRLATTASLLAGQRLRRSAFLAVGSPCSPASSAGPPYWRLDPPSSLLAGLLGRSSLLAGELRLSSLAAASASCGPAHRLRRRRARGWGSRAGGSRGWGRREVRGVRRWGGRRAGQCRRTSRRWATALGAGELGRGLDAGELGSCLSPGLPATAVLRPVCHPHRYGGRPGRRSPPRTRWPATKETQRSALLFSFLFFFLFF